MQPGPCQRRGEKGQTIVLVAVSLLSLLAMAALAIDVVTLYVARTEIQRAADAVALAAAKGIADSGITTLPSGDLNCNAAGTLAQTMANAEIAAALPSNLVAGNPPAQVGSPTFTPGFPPACPVSNPRVTVTLQQTNLPTLFARIWSKAAATVTASATAEAYNPANPPVLTPAFNPIAPSSVKPWLVANKDPVTSVPFVDITSGAVEAANSVVGKTFDLTADCQNGSPFVCNLIPPNPPTATSSSVVQYVPAPPSINPANVCPSCEAGSDYEKTIACADADRYTYFQCGSNDNAVKVSWYNGVNPSNNGTKDSEGGIECLIHASAKGANQGQDFLDKSPWPGNPMKIEKGGNGGPLTSTSSSIVTIPIIDTTPPFPGTPGPVTIVGFLQAFINCVEDGVTPQCGAVGGGGSGNAGDINITVLNVVGCSNSPNGNAPVVGGNGASAIPVRLISP